MRGIVGLRERLYFALDKMIIELSPHWSQKHLLPPGPLGSHGFRSELSTAPTSSFALQRIIEPFWPQRWIEARMVTVEPARFVDPRPDEVFAPHGDAIIQNASVAPTPAKPLPAAGAIEMAYPLAARTRFAPRIQVGTPTMSEAAPTSAKMPALQ